MTRVTDEDLEFLHGDYAMTNVKLGLLSPMTTEATRAPKKARTK